jgi:hypothetical protein
MIEKIVPQGEPYSGSPFAITVVPYRDEEPKFEPLKSALQSLALSDP